MELFVILFLFGASLMYVIFQHHLYRSRISAFEDLPLVNFEQRRYPETLILYSFLDGKQLPYVQHLFAQRDLHALMGCHGVQEKVFIDDEGKKIQETESFLHKVHQYESLIAVLTRRYAGRPQRSRASSGKAPYAYISYKVRVEYRNVSTLIV